MEEETYSLIFASLRNPIRRRILRMLAKKHLVFSGLTFSQMLESLAIDSGHLSYHLDKMGELLTHDSDGKYGLSSVGIAAARLMTGVEDYPNALRKRWFKRRANLGIFLIATALIVVLIISWLCVNMPRYETLFYGRIKFTRSDGETYRGWFFYEFDVTRKTELFIKIEQALPNEDYTGLFWYLSNSTKETVENTTHWYPSLVYTAGTTQSRTYEKTIMVSQTGDFTFILFLPSFSPIQTVTVYLELSSKLS